MSTTTHHDVPGTIPDTVPDTASGVLAGLRQAQATADLMEVRKLDLAVTWAAQHSADSITASWHEASITLAGPGAPLVAEHCVVEFAAALGISTDAGRDRLGEAIEIAHRLPRTYAAVRRGGVRAWRARRLATLTMGLSLEAARFADVHLAPVIAKIGWTAIERLLDEAQTRYDPAAAEARRRAAAEHRHFDINLDHYRCGDTVQVTGSLDLADAIDLDHAVTRRAAHLADLGCTDALDVRRAAAVGEIARHDVTLDLDAEVHPEPDVAAPARPAPARPAPAGRRVVLHVHLTGLPALGDAAIGRLEHTRSPVTVEQVRAWCANPDAQITVKPVIDLADGAHVDAYEIPDRMREQVELREPTCVFPWCTRPSRRCDLDHITPYDTGGSTSPPNLAPLCRRHHRTKTHTAWTYRHDKPGCYQWTSPHGLTFSVTRGLTEPTN